jgi:CubicO group peptidase (beta-lactamase class C family)
MKYLLVLIIMIPIFAFSQNIPTEEQIKAVNSFYDGYNQKDYSKMRQPMSGVLKLAFSKGNLEKGYGAALLMNGKARIVSIKSTSEAGVAVEVTYEKDTTETQRMGFMFNNKNKFIGLSNRSNKFQYPVSNDETSLSETIMQWRIDSILQLKYKAGVFTGCVLVMDKGKVIYKNCAGFADYENKIFLNDSSVFELASCSKQFTAMAIMILAERGKLNYTDNIKQYIPELPYDDITVENLLVHTSGLPDYEEMLDEHWDKKKFVTNYDIVSCFAKYKPSTDFKPGKKYEYSNTGYALLSVIIEKVSGMSYSDFLATNIFRPLGMTHSLVYNTRRVKNDKVNNYAYGYVYSDSLRQYVLPDILPENNYVIYQDAITGDGTVNSCILDLVLWEKALRENRLVSKSTIDKAFTKAKLNSGEQVDYGYGWEIQSDDKFERIAYHSGNWPGYTAYTIHFIDKEKSIAILSNSEYINIAKFAKKLGSILTEKK